MINVNVKSVQNGEIVSKIKEIIGIHATFVRYDDANNSKGNVDLQERINPLEDLNLEVEVVNKAFEDAFENILLQKSLYPDLHVVIPANSNIKPNKITQVWAFVNNKIRKIFSLISSCFGSGTWLRSEKWVDTDLWKY